MSHEERIADALESIAASLEEISESMALEE
jgi:hypothetical protein